MKNPFLDKIFLNTKNVIEKSNFSQEIKEEFLSFMNFESINEENFKRIIKLLKSLWWDEKIFVYDEKLLKENFYKNSVKNFFNFWEKMYKFIEK